MSELTTELLLEIPRMENEIIYLQESLDSCSIRQQKARELVRIREVQISNLEFIDESNQQITQELDSQIKDLNKALKIERRKTRVLKITTAVGFALVPVVVVYMALNPSI